MWAGFLEHEQHTAEATGHVRVGEKVKFWALQNFFEKVEIWHSLLSAYHSGSLSDDENSVHTAIEAIINSQLISGFPG